MTDQVADREHLVNLIDAQPDGVPCTRGDSAPSSWWTADSLSQQSVAAEICRRVCPSRVRSTCLAYGREYKDEFGCYGGESDYKRSRIRKEKSA